MESGLICEHCKMDISIRNPSGYCDHLYYPDNCKICQHLLRCEEVNSKGLRCELPKNHEGFHEVTIKF